MTDTFNGSRDAVAYALSHRRGPQAARPSLGRGPGGFRSAWDGSAVRACMVRCGVQPDSSAERELHAWACEGGPKPVVLERKLRRELDSFGLLKRHEPQAMTRRCNLAVVTWTDPETGAEVTTKAAARSEDR